MKKIFRLFIKNIAVILLFGFIAVNLLIAFRINVFRYHNFDFGKFDLGNMTQMVWNTLNGRFLYLTDYFGTNLPRWAMSHVDPILLLFVPIFALYQHPLTLVFSQLILVIFSSVVIYKIALLELKSKWASSLIAISYLLYPALGYINAITGFHGVTAVIPFFLLAFYVFEKMYKENNFNLKNILVLWFFLILTMSGKEQVPLYVFMWGIFVLLFRVKISEKFKFDKEWFKKYFKKPAAKIGLSMVAVGFLWFFLAFFVIIPKFASYRIEGYQEFERSLDLDSASLTDVDLPNYFLSRYEAFGDSYTEVIINMILNPNVSIRVFFGGDNIENLQKTFAPLAYTPLLYPPLLLISLPDFMINYLTSTGGIGTAEIENHRISMIIPVLFISLIYGISYISRYLKEHFKVSHKVTKLFINIFPIFIVLTGIYTTFSYNNPIYLWLDQAVRKRVFAIEKTEVEQIREESLQLGALYKLPALDNKDVACSNKIVQLIPDNASVSGPDNLGAHLSMRETYAIFPALYNSADYVIVDVFSQKILRILDADVGLVKDVVLRMLSNPNYEIETGCGNLFLFKKVGEHGKTKKLPLQERYEYEEKYNFELFNELYIVDFSFPNEIQRGQAVKADIVYIRKDDEELNGFVVYMSYINEETGEFYQVANLPTFAISSPEEFNVQRYYLEKIDIAFPRFLDAGVYKAFIGMSNKIKTRNVYLGDIIVK